MDTDFGWKWMTLGFGLFVDNSFPFESGTFEVDDQTDGVTGDLQVVEHLADFMVSDAVDDFGVKDYQVVDNQVGYVFSDFVQLVDDFVARLLLPRNSS
jgi:hypothetical protein